VNALAPFAALGRPMLAGLSAIGRVAISRGAPRAMPSTRLITPTGC
jgi:hypothetical protein